MRRTILEDGRFAAVVERVIAFGSTEGTVLYYGLGEDMRKYIIEPFIKEDKWVWGDDSLVERRSRVAFAEGV